MAVVFPFIKCYTVNTFQLHQIGQPHRAESEVAGLQIRVEFLNSPLKSDCINSFPHT